MQAQLMEVRNFKALLCQIKPQHKDISKSINRADESLKMYSPASRLDIIAFPQMSFTGYNFTNAEEALPYAAAAGQGLEFQFASKIAVRINCYVAYGYIERSNEGGETVLHNSAAVLDRAGKMILNYRKSHLYYNDKLWAKEGKEFSHFDLVTIEGKLIRITVGICMDICPKDFASSQFQLADYVCKSGSDVLLFLTNWVDSQKDLICNNDITATYNYWLHRLNPMVNSKRTTLFLAADRVGKEYDVFAKKETMFYGSSCAIMINPFKVIKNLDITSEGYLLIDTFIP